MPGFLFNDIIFGPVKSRRLGVSLGVNVLPISYKYCSYNCIYCECGWTEKQVSEKIKLPQRKEIYVFLEKKLAELQQGEIAPDSITFAGNGEPSLHPEFTEIVDDTISLRNRYFPQTAITVLSNASLIHKENIFNALQRVDKNILKLDAGSNDLFQKINCPNGILNIEKLTDNLCKFKGKLIIQSLFLKGVYHGAPIDNTTDEEVNLWLAHLKKIRPELVMLYPIDRKTPLENLEKIPPAKLQQIAERVNALGIKTRVY